MKKANAISKWFVFAMTIVCVFVLSTSLFAQRGNTRVIAGRVAGTGDSSIADASVLVRGTKNGVNTDANGDFTISAQTGDVLVVSHVGYKERDITVGAGNSKLTIRLTEDLSSLQDVVVVGYGRMRKSDMSSAVLTISSADIEKTVNTTLDQALQGKSPNVYVSQSSGAPGAGASVIIRGISTVTGNYQPLYVIDGVQIRPSMASGGAYNSSSGVANELAGLNPEDIENISVLEGPAATSIYGAGRCKWCVGNNNKTRQGRCDES